MCVIQYLIYWFYSKSTGIVTIYALAFNASRRRGRSELFGIPISSRGVPLQMGYP